MRSNAICLRCGEWKSNSLDCCSSCGFAPSPGSDDEVKSVYLSVGRFEDGDERRQYRKDLGSIRDAIRSGTAIKFEENEMGRLKQQRQTFRATSTVSAWKAVLKLFFPAVLTLAGLLALVFLLRLLR